jgi:alpha-tubulin suppressor-like RCC1 family protein
VTKLPNTVKFVRVECGGDFTFALGRDGEVFSWGLNIKGQLGHGHFEPVASAAQLRYLSSPTDPRSPRVIRRSRENSDDIKLSFGEKICNVSCGALHSLLLTNKGRIFACGYGETFALGLNNKENQCTFCEISHLTSSEFFEKNITKISTGISHSACLVNGVPYIWGLWGSKPGMMYQVPTQVSIPQGNDILNRLRQ